jgi:hypothetical protein
MIETCRKHEDWFAHIVSLVDRNEKLADVNWDPQTWSAALEAGSSQADIDTYVHLLKKVGANRGLVGVYGIGKVCLITADIVYGIFASVRKSASCRSPDLRQIVKERTRRLCRSMRKSSL